MVAAAPCPGSDGADSAGCSLHDVVADALVSAVDDLDAEERTRSIATRAGVKRGPRPVSKPVVAQLSMLDTTDDAELDTESEQCP